MDDRGGVAARLAAAAMSGAASDEALCAMWEGEPWGGLDEATLAEVVMGGVLQCVGARLAAASAGDPRALVACVRLRGCVGALLAAVEAAAHTHEGCGALRDAGVFDRLEHLAVAGAPAPQPSAGAGQRRGRGDAKATPMRLLPFVMAFGAHQGAYARLCAHMPPAAALGRRTPTPLCSSFTYGEIEFFGFAEILARALGATPPRSHEGAFVDLGCGSGRPMVAAALLWPAFTAVRGVELLDVLADECAAAIDAAAGRASGGLPMAPLELRRGDLLDEDLSDVAVVFSHCTCFDEVRGGAG